MLSEVELSFLKTVQFVVAPSPGGDWPVIGASLVNSGRGGTGGIDSSSSWLPSLIVVGLALPLIPFKSGRPLWDEKDEKVDGVEPDLPLPWLCIDLLYAPLPPAVVLARPTSLRTSFRGRLYRGALAGEPCSEEVFKGARGGNEERGLAFLT